MKIINLLFVVVGMTSNAGAETATVQSITSKIGSAKGGVRGLAQAGDERVVKIEPASSKGSETHFQLQASSLKGKAQVVAVFKQKKSNDSFTFQVRKANGSWQQLGTSTQKTGYQALKFELPTEFMKGTVLLRLKAGQKTSSGVLDYLALNDPTSPTQPPVEPQPLPPPKSSEPSLPSQPAPQPGPILETAQLVPGIDWYWQLQGTIKQNITARVIDIDLENTSAATISALKSSGKYVVCYFSAGSYEDWRADAKSFPAAALGSTLDGWPGERWLDVRNSTVRQIMAARMDVAKSKGCDALEPDNVDGYANKNGVGLSMQDQINYLSYLAGQAHARGLSIALKNSTDLVGALVSEFDFAIVEECFKYNECSAYKPFINQNKALLNAEYSSYSDSICTQAKALKFSTVFFNLELNGGVFKPCP